jgi:hypothetical protein
MGTSLSAREMQAIVSACEAAALFAMAMIRGGRCT